MSKGLIIVNRFCDIPAISTQANRLKEEFASLGAEVSIVKNGYLPYLNGNCEIEGDFGGVDFVIYLDKDKYQGEILKQGRYYFRREIFD